MYRTHPTIQEQAQINTSHLATRTKKIVVLIPAYNEERFIGSVVLQTLKYVDDVIVIDDGSTDKTAEIANAAGAIVLKHETNFGKGIALNTGFEYARLLDPDVVITFDGDYQHLPEELMSVAIPIIHNEADIVVGSRYIGDASDVPLQRIIGHWGFTTLTNVLSGTSLTDSQSGFRAFSKTALLALTFSSKSFSVESEMQFLAKDQKLRVVEVPITIKYPDKPKRSVINHGFIVLNGILGLVIQHRPLLFFSILGMTFILIGSAAGLWVINRYQESQELAIGTALIVVILITTGFSIIFTGILLHTIRALRVELEKALKPKNT